MDKVHGALKAMAHGLGDKPYCHGIHLSLADVAVGCCLAWLSFRFPNLTWAEDHPNLARHLDKLMTRASFAETVPVV